MSGELRGFDISTETKRIIDSQLKKYYELIDEAGELDDEDYYSALSPSYDRIMTSPTNTITKTVEMVAIRMSEKRLERDRAAAIVKAIDKGIERSANTAREDLAEDLKYDLRKNMIDKRPRELFARHTKTFTKYRRRAYYFIAEEMHLVERR